MSKAAFILPTSSSHLIPVNQAGFSKQSVDLSLYDVEMPWGKGEFGLVGALENSGKNALGQQAPDSQGVALTFIHTHEKFLSDDGFNKFSLQIGNGAAKTFTSGYETATTTNGTFIIPDQPGFVAVPRDGKFCRPTLGEYLHQPGRGLSIY